MAHYFDLDPTLASKQRLIEYFIDGHSITLVSDNGVFSKNKIDEGSFAFLKVIVPLRLSGKILDLGCGLGRHSMLFYDYGFNVTACDITPYAIEYITNWQKERKIRAQKALDSVGLRRKS